jgi:hypothetical protein
VAGTSVHKCVLQFAFTTENPVCMVFQQKLVLSSVLFVALFLQCLENYVY